jgi:hypothetical protein
MDRAWRSLAYLCAGAKLAVANGSTVTSRGNMRPKELVQSWIDAFNQRDAALAELYSEKVINHQ